MVNPKLVSVFCGVGFLLSFLIGLISGNPFLTVLIRAFVSCLSFGVIAAAISFAYNRFLNVQVSEVSEASPETPSEATSFDAEDEALTEDNGPGFYVDESSKMRSFKSIRSEETGSAKQHESEGVKGYGGSAGSFSSASGNANSRLEDVSVIPEESSVSSFKPEQADSYNAVNSAAGTQTSRTTANSLSDELDELPEIASHETQETSETVESIIDSDDGGTTTQFVPAGLEEIASSNDASVMASAIRTVLSSDN